jgi:hypothetical protein
MDNSTGVAKTEYRINNGEWTEYTEPINSFTEGKNVVDYRSIDNAGNVEEIKSFEVKIDKTAPTLNVSFDQSIIRDRNYQFVPINASVEAVDNLSGVDSYELVSIVSNQQDNAKGDGNTIQDIQGAKFGTPDTNFLVLAERSGSGDRVYTITYKTINLSITKNQENNKRNEKAIELDHTYTSDHVTQPFVQLVKTFIPAAETIEEYWRMTVIAAYRNNREKEADTILSVAMHSIKQFFRKIKAQRITKPIAYYYGILDKKFTELYFEELYDMGLSID